MSNNARLRATKRNRAGVFCAKADREEKGLSRKKAQGSQKGTRIMAGTSGTKASERKALRGGAGLDGFGSRFLICANA
jgi:hypothetical protein